MRILLVDDEADYVSTLAERLSFRGIEAQWASGGQEALKYLETNHYDLAILDVKMPKIGGIELKRQIEKKYSHMKFIYLTGHGSEDDYQKGVADSVHYLIKPVNIDDLIKMMNKVMEGKN
ncbi:MAG: response regulator [Desulfamplus sp.]|nr:response regulator [Desulfamplus sp.]